MATSVAETVTTQPSPSSVGPPQTVISCPDCQLVEVTGVVDGDTLDTNVGKVRFFGIDTPERGDECFTEATEFTQLLVGDQVRLQDGPRLEDAYGRRLAYVFDSSGNSIDVQLIAGGFATAWTRDGQHRDVLIGLEESARSNNAGCLWGEFAPIPITQPGATPSPLPTPTVIVNYQPTENDFLRAWGAREPWIPLPASRSFSGWIDETELVFRLYTAIWIIDTANKNGALTRESFNSFVSRSPLDLSVRPRQALLALLEHPQGVVDNASWMYEPRSNWEASLGCALAYVEGRRRSGVSWEFFGSGGTVVESCDQGSTRPPPWVSYLSQSEVERDRDWIEYLAQRWGGIE
ncbi:thermonuclease family protein [Candidatus Lucifugimonas marina]|uniref:thermonuclease family protein n=1 Tax=Candidatus Lucifugimonas marina TaxID=3038979 RepID=UPI00319D9685